MALKLDTAPVIEPVTLDEAKLHLRVSIPDDNLLIENLIKTAREHVETITRRALIEQTWEMTLDTWPAGNMLRLPLPPLISVTSVKYKDENGAETTWPMTNYIVDTDNEPGQIVLASGATWPGGTLYPINGIRVKYKAGYGDEAEDVPLPIRQAILLLVGHYYEHRESVLMTAGMQILPMGIADLLATYRIPIF